MAKIPPISRRQTPKFSNADHRNISAGAFSQGGKLYHKVRPSYPQEVLQLLDPAVRVLDIGAGTGKLTEQLSASPQFEQVYACDPSANMLRVLTGHCAVPVWQATAEYTAVADGFFDALTCAQTWHWVDPAAACLEFDRITSENGQVLLVWNTLDVTIPWVHRLSRIMHSGDTLTKGFYPTIHPPWRIAAEHRSIWWQQLSVTQVHYLMHSRSYWLRSNETTRAKLTTNLQWYLEDHLGFDADATVEVPYRCDGFLLHKGRKPDAQC